MIRSLFKKEKLKARNFFELKKSTDLIEIEAIKLKLEKYKIPVYIVNQVLNSKESAFVYYLRIPEQYKQLAKEIFEDDKK